jgi:ADP-ribosylglycohydrolase
MSAVSDPAPTSEPTEASDPRVRAALAGIQIGDALAMPVHWYYDRTQLAADYGQVVDFLAPKNPHSGSILWRSHWEAPSLELDILGDQRRFWGQRGVHYHQNLAAGEMTLTGKLAFEVQASLEANGGYDRADALRRYIDLLTHPERHRDSYVEECHRGFFTNLGRGVAPEKCAVEEKHIGGLVPMLAVALYYADDPDTGRERALEHLAITHAGKAMRKAAGAVLDVLYRVLAGEGLGDVIRAECASQRHPMFQFPLVKWLDETDERVVGRRLSTACYIDQSVPAVFYLALKYARDPEAGLVANTNLGGDNVHRGAVLGALLGAANGEGAWPKRWLDGLAPL